MIEHAYIHIPFCIRKCNYCSFVSGENILQKEQYLNALNKEIKTRYKNEKLKTLYLGGGTPSLLNVEDLENIISNFNFQTNPEITLEANPETVSLDKFKQIKDSGINRISLGVQTFNDEILYIIGRKHTASNIFEAVCDLKNAGFKNISIDLIYGLPKQNQDIFKSDLIKAIELDIQHISSYGLKIEENSYFYNNPPQNLPNEDIQAQMFLFMCKKLKENNFLHYEISNFSKENFESKHNYAYWENKNYYGFGLNASGYEGKCRYRNKSNIIEYIQNPQEKEEQNILTLKEILEEEIFLALRLKNGINIDLINNKYNIDFENKYKNIINKYKQTNLITIENNHFKLTEKGFLVSNEIMSEFLD